MSSRLPVYRQHDEKYHAIGEHAPMGIPPLEEPTQHRKCISSPVKERLAILAAVLFVIALLTRSPVSHSPLQPDVTDTSKLGSIRKSYQSPPKIWHYWGPNSPFFSLEHQSEISTAVPPTCKITFVQVLSRHGARYPTSHKDEKYAELVDNIHKTATAYKGDFAVLKDYKYQLGVDNLTEFGEQQLVVSGMRFYERYKSIARDNVPFVRSAGSSRVVASGELFNQGFQAAKDRDPASNKTQQSPVINVVIPEGSQWNNTLDVDTCPSFQNDTSADTAQEKFLSVFAPPILQKITAGLPGTKLGIEHVPLIMDLCPFETVAQTNTSKVSPLCNLFTLSEWQSYDYYNTLGKYYGYGQGSPLGPTQGVGFVNEVIARMTQSPVKDHTSVNNTLDSNAATFPLGAALYADFSHDNTITSIYYALGLYNETTNLPTDQVQSADESNGYSSSWTVPFASRAYIEMMQCDDRPTGSEPLVRILVNDRVVPLRGCNVDALGRCERHDWIQGLAFARNGGDWGNC